MIIALNKEDLYTIKDSFIDYDYMENEFIHNPYARLLILEEDNIIIGYLYYSDIYDRLEINQIEIEINHRNCGKGSMLLDYFTENVDKNITLEVREDNLPALNLYKKFDFEQTATRKGYYNGVDGLLMERISKNKAE